MTTEEMQGIVLDKAAAVHKKYGAHDAAIIVGQAKKHMELLSKSGEANGDGVMFATYDLVSDIFDGLKEIWEA